MKSPADKKEDRIRAYFASKTGQLPDQVDFNCDCLECGYGWTSWDDGPIAYCPKGSTPECGWSSVEYIERHTGYVFPRRECLPTGAKLERARRAAERKVKEAEKEWKKRKK